MILSPPTRAILHPVDPDEPSLCLDSGLLNPQAFIPQLRRYPWFPFEDLAFGLEEVSAILAYAANTSSLFRQTMPCRNKVIEYFEIVSPDVEDTTTIKDWFSYDEGILWSTSGIVIINSYADYVILAMPDELSMDVFGQCSRAMFDDSVSIFNDDPRNPTVAAFMTVVMDTWN